MRQSIFATLVEVLVSPKHAFLTHQPPLQVTFTSQLIFYVRCQVWTLRWMTQQIDVLIAQKCSCCSWEEWSVFGGWFSWYLEKQLTNKCFCITQNLLFSVILIVPFATSEVKKKTGWKCFVRKPFVGFNSAFNIHAVDCCSLRAQKHKFTFIHHLSQWLRRVSKHRSHIFLIFPSTLDFFCTIDSQLHLCTDSGSEWHWCHLRNHIQISIFGRFRRTETAEGYRKNMGFPIRGVILICNKTFSLKRSMVPLLEWHAKSSCWK